MNTIASWLAAASGLLGFLASSAAQPLSVEHLRESVRHATGWETLPKTASGGVMLSGTTNTLSIDADATLLFDYSGHLSLQQSGLIPMTRSIGSSGPWMLDIGGEFRGLSLGEGEDLIILAQVISGQWAFESSPLRLEIDQARTSPEKVVATFVLPGPGGEPLVTHGEIDVDRKTWKPTACRVHAGKDTTTITFGGSAMLDEVWFPAEVTIAAKSSNSSFHFAKAAPAPTFVRSPYDPPRPIGSRPTDVVFDRAVPSILERRRAKTGHSLVKVLIDSKPGWFIFDTGAGATVIDQTFADSIALKPFGSVEAVGVGGSVTTAFVRSKSLTVGPATLTDPLMARLDLSKIGAAIGEDLAGVLGYNVMHRSIAKLHTDDGTVELFDPATFDDKGLAWFPLTVYERHACIEAAFEDHRGIFKLDTGAGVLPVSMHAPAVVRLKLLEGRQTQDGHAGGVGGRVAVKTGSLRWLEIGGRREENVPANFALEPKGALADEFTLGNLSPRQIGPRDIVFDYVGGRIAYPERKPAPESK
ncbi:MAG: retropepsin-like aspartic protease [Planctomycetota bacterium]